MKKPRYLSLLTYVLFLALGLLMLYFAFEGQDIGEIIKNLKNANYFWIAISLITMLLSHLFRALRWQMLISPLGKTPKITNTYHAVIIGYMANLALPRLGEISRCGILNRTDGIPVDKLIGTVITERLIDILTFFVIIVLALLVTFNEIVTFVRLHIFNGLTSANGNIWWLTLLAIAVLMAGLFMAVRIFQRHKLAILRSRFCRKILKLWKGFGQGISTVKNMKNTGQFMVYSVLIWAGYLLSTYFVFKALAGTEQLGLDVALFVLVVGSMGMAVPVQAGIGPYHWLVSEGLTLFGISRTTGLTFATISHTSSQIVLILVTGAISLALIFWETRKQPAPKP